MSDERTLGQIIREARESKGLSREDVLAQLRNVRPVALMSIEEDLDPEPLAQDLFFLARLLGLDYPALLARVGYLPPKGGEPPAH